MYHTIHKAWIFVSAEGSEGGMYGRLRRKTRESSHETKGTNVGYEERVPCNALKFAPKKRLHTLSEFL